MNQEIINLYDEYTHKPLKRQDFISRLAKITGSLAAAMALLPMLELNYANAATVAVDDKDIITEDIEYDGDGYAMKAYLARPRSDKKFGAVMVIHENRGLNEHIKDVTRRLAKAGFLAIAPDALSAAGGTPPDEEQARSMFGSLDADKNLNSFVKGIDYLANHASSNGKTGTVGFCWGGAMANQLAVHVPVLKAAVPFYGRQPELADVPKIKARLQLHYGEKDERINAGIPAFEEALKKNKIPYELFIYPDTQHAFHNDTAPTRYNAAAAKLAWERTLKLFKETIA